jgi:hypothetical protein
MRLQTMNVVPGWEMPAPPVQECPQPGCGQPVVPIAYHCGGAEVGLFWACRDELHELPSDASITWPFTEEGGTFSDLERLGFILA